MDIKTRFNTMRQKFQQQDGGQKGQSLVIIALVLIALIGFLGVALDVGLIFVRGSQLQAAVDAATLAGVQELYGYSSTNTAPLNDAKTKSMQFLNANNMPPPVTASIDTPGYIAVEETELRATQYSLTATWPVETNFLKVLGFREPINLTRSATAAVFTLADIYASRRVEDGVLSTSNQAVFGPGQCTRFGDPYSPASSFEHPGLYTYEYRILVPPDYQNDVSNIVRVELFDPDSHNQPDNNFTVYRSDTAINLGGLGVSANKSCTGDSSRRWNPCLLNTDEQSTGIDLDLINPYWFVRIDENRVPGCGNTNSYNPANNTETVYELYYYRENTDGTINRVPLAFYTGKADNADDTDMRWVSPGTEMSFAFDFDPIPGGVDVNTDPGSPGDFEVNLATEVPGIVTDPGNGNRYIYLDVTSISGSSENGFEVWAGPENYVSAVPSDVNDRNLHILNNPGSHKSGGVTVFGLGNLPMNSNFSNPVDIPLIYVGPEYAGGEILVNIFDPDSGAKPPITFYWDSIARLDWEMKFGDNGQPSEGRCFEGGTGYNDECNDKWSSYTITVPGVLDECDWANPTQEDCTPFYGGRLMVNYDGGFSDTYGWEISLRGLPYLVR